MLAPPTPNMSTHSISDESSYSSIDQATDTALISNLISTLPTLYDPDSLNFFVKAIEKLELSSFTPLHEDIVPHNRMFIVSNKAAKALFNRLNSSHKEDLKKPSTYQELMVQLRTLASNPTWTDLYVGHFDISNLFPAENETYVHVVDKIETFVNHIMSPDHLYFMLVSYILRQSGRSRAWSETGVFCGHLLMKEAQYLQTPNPASPIQVTPAFHELCVSFLRNYPAYTSRKKSNNFSKSGKHSRGNSSRPSNNKKF